MVKIRRAFSVVLAFLLMLVPVKTFAADLYQMQILQAEIEKPKIVAYFNFSDTNNSTNNRLNISKEDISVFLGNEELAVSSLETQKKSGYGVSYYYLIDNSTSVPEYYFKEIKESIANHIDHKNEKDKIIVISFASEIKVVLDGSENKIKAKSAVDEMKRASGGTRLYDAIAKATDLVDSSKNTVDERSVIFVATDGVDKVAGGNTVEEVTERLKVSNIPIYAFGYEYASKESLDSLGELARTTTGKMSVMSLSGIVSSMQSIVDEVQNTYRVVAFSENNIIDSDFANVRITAETDGEKYEAQISVISTEWQKDTTYPKIENVAVKNEYCLEILFSENVEIAGKTAFKIETGDKELAVKSIKYSKDVFSCTVETEEKLYNGEYTVSASGIKDVSMEENPLENEKYAFTIDSVPKDFNYFIAEYSTVIWICVGIIIIAILIPVIIKSRKKAAEKREEEAEVIKRGNAVVLPEIDGIKAEITVIDSHKIERRVKCVIGGAYIIGRDEDKCDLAIDDKHLSHQHAALIYENNILSIQDLESTNGTKVNGIAIRRVRNLVPGDVIEIGNTRLRVKIFPD